MTVGERKKKRREEIGLSQEELANRLGNRSRASVCTVENNRESLTVDRVWKYAEALECSPAYILGLESENESIQTIGDRIRQKRMEKGLSQSELAIKSHYSDKTRISKIENSGDNLTRKVIKRMAEALGASEAYLMGWEHIDQSKKEKQIMDAIKQDDKVGEIIDLIIKSTQEVRSAVLLLLKPSQRD